MQFRSLFDVHVRVGGRGRVVLVGGGDVKAHGEVVLTVGSFSGDDQRRHGSCHVDLHGCAGAERTLFKFLDVTLTLPISIILSLATSY